MRIFLVLIAIGLTGCGVARSPFDVPALQASDIPVEARPAVVAFDDVMTKMMPVIEKSCKAGPPERNCDFLVLIDTNIEQPPNAFQTEDETGRPVIGFTVSLLLDVQNQDEMALVLGHEAAHHMLGHLTTQSELAEGHGAVFGNIARSAGANPRAIRQIEDLGRAVGARRFSKQFELEADALGAKLAKDGGFDPLRGIEYFLRIADPGNKFLGTHPANSRRYETVVQAIRS